MPAGAVWKHHVEEEFGINYRTFLRYLHTDTSELEERYWSRKGLDAPYSRMYDKNEPASYRRTEQHSGIPYDRSYRTQRKTENRRRAFLAIGAVCSELERLGIQPDDLHHAVFDEKLSGSPPDRRQPSRATSTPIPDRQSGQGRNPTRSRCRQTWHRVARRTATRPQERTHESIPTDRQSTRPSAARRTFFAG